MVGMGEGEGGIKGGAPKGLSAVSFLSKKVLSKTSFMENHICQKSVSSKTIFIQKP